MCQIHKECKQTQRKHLNEMHCTLFKYLRENKIYNKIKLVKMDTLILFFQDAFLLTYNKDLVT